MSYPKIDEFTDNQQEIALFAKALSHPARIAIIELLARRKNCYSGNIADEIPLSRTTVSQHLQELKKSGLIKGEIEGQKVEYCIHAENFNRLKLLLEEFLCCQQVQKSNC